MYTRGTHLFLSATELGVSRGNGARLTQQSNTASCAIGPMLAPTDLPATQPCEDSAARAGWAPDDLPASPALLGVWARSSPQSSCSCGPRKALFLVSTRRVNLLPRAFLLSVSTPPSPRQALSPCVWQTENFRGFRENRRAY